MTMKGWGRMSRPGIEMNTFSITARDEKTGQFGVAVSTKRPSVGALCPHARANVGAIATQAFVNPYYGVDGLTYLEQGISANETLSRLLDADEYRELRQVAIVDNTGHAVAFTGDQCTEWHGHIVG